MITQLRLQTSWDALNEAGYANNIVDSKLQHLPFLLLRSGLPVTELLWSLPGTHNRLMFLGLLISDISIFRGASGTSATVTQDIPAVLRAFKPKLVACLVTLGSICSQPRLTQDGEQGSGVHFVQTGSSDARVDSSVTQGYIHYPQHTIGHSVPEIWMT